mmetsp:Transcript_46792/g.106112  ORF Transcript_46792/g.106112 Transcript_46792/m.106112 type:complete len:196 (-) Transcript_46792:70-657(-)
MVFLGLLASGEALVPALAAGFGVAAAAVFVATSGGGEEGTARKPMPWDKSSDGAEDDSEDESFDSVAAKVNASDSASARRRMTPEQEQQIRQRMKQLPPDTKKALDEWVNMSESSKMGLLAVNCLFVILFLGLFLLFAAYLISEHNVNIFQLETWTDGSATLKKLMKSMHKAGRPSSGGSSGTSLNAETGHSAEL